MPRLSPLSTLRVPLGGQEIELQQVDFEAGGMSLLRTRIREKSRFTINNNNPATTKQKNKTQQQKTHKQPRG